MIKDVLVVDYGMGNLLSVANAFNHIGATTIISGLPEDIGTTRAVVLPGVGSFGDAITNLGRQGWIDALEREVLRGGKPFMGVCLGMQLLAEVGDEGGEKNGLGWFKGKVARLKVPAAKFRLPHIGWNEVAILSRNCMYDGITSCNDFYFLHSYVFKPDDDSIVNGVCKYGKSFVASLEKENIWATQYHPEKSQKAGLDIFRNFLGFAQNT